MSFTPRSVLGALHSTRYIGGNWKTYNLWILGRWIGIREEQQHETGEDQRTGEEEDERLNCSDAAWLLNLSDNPNPLR